MDLLVSGSSPFLNGKWRKGLVFPFGARLLFVDFFLPSARPMRGRARLEGLKGRFGGMVPYPFVGFLGPYPFKSPQSSVVLMQISGALDL